MKKTKTLGGEKEGKNEKEKSLRNNVMNMKSKTKQQL